MSDTEATPDLRDDKVRAPKIGADEWSIPIASNAATYLRHMQSWRAFSYQRPERNLPELFKPSISLATAEWYAECAVAGAALMHDCVDVKLHVKGGRPVLKGTGFTVASTLAELAETNGVDEVADNFNLKAQTIRDLLNGLSLLFERSFRP